jgi:hypothetical protein
MTRHTNRAAAAVAALGLLVVGVAGPAQAGTVSFAIMGDIPGGSAQIAAFPGRIGQINADPDVQLVGHLGDIGHPPTCSDAYYATIRHDFDRFSDPLVYTPGDNDWADCHRAQVGRGNPLSRLAALRAVFFPVAGQTLGQNKAAVSVPSDGYPENVMLDRAGITVAAVHVVGSNNDLLPWNGLGYSQPTSAQLAEEAARTSADVALIRGAFARATASNSRAVVLLMHADMFVGTPTATYRTAYQPIVRTIAAQSVAFKRPVFLFNGDSHGFASNKPLTSSKWLSCYGISGAVSNLSRITVEGSYSVDEWVKVNVVAGPSVLEVHRVAYR